MPRFYGCSFVAALSLTLACQDTPTGISMTYTTVSPVAVSIDARTPNGNLLVELELADPVTLLPDNVRIPVTARSSSEDVETVLVRPVICEDPEFGMVFCGQFGIGTNQGDTDSLAERLREYGAFILQEISWRGVIAYFPYGSLAEILDTVGRWPGVRFVEPEGVAVGAGSQTPQTIMRGYMRIEHAAVSPGNDFLEARSLDTVSVEYTPSAGPILAKSFVFQ